MRHGISPRPVDRGKRDISKGEAGKRLDPQTGF